MKTFGFFGLGLVMLSLMNCAGGYVTDNGIFQNDQKELIETLVGSWQVVSPEVEVDGTAVYEFYRDKKEVKLKVLGNQAEIQRFDSSDGLSFTIEYALADGEPVYLVGQFKSGMRNELVCMQQGSTELSESLSVMKLQKRPATSAVAVE